MIIFQSVKSFYAHITVSTKVPATVARPLAIKRTFVSRLMRKDDPEQYTTVFLDEMVYFGKVL